MILASPSTATFDEIVEVYESDPVKFSEGLLRGWYECVVSDECSACHTHYRFMKAVPRHVTRKNHDEVMRKIPRQYRFELVHRFQRDTAFFRVAAMSKEQVLLHVKRLWRNPKREHHADLLALYYREKFAPAHRAGAA